MAKIVLGQRPEKFSRTVKFPMLDGTDGVIKCEFMYRTKREYAELVDKLNEGGKLNIREDGSIPNLQELISSGITNNAWYLGEVLLGWDVDAELNEANLQELADAYPAAASAIMEAYRVGCIEGKLGN
jgi:hypothetical protein